MDWKTADLQWRSRKDGNMQETQITITVRSDGSGDAPHVTVNNAQQEQQNEEICNYTEEEQQRFAVASDLANVCEYLEDSEVIKIRLIVQKCEARKERDEG